MHSTRNFKCKKFFITYINFFNDVHDDRGVHDVHDVHGDCDDRDVHRVHDAHDAHDVRDGYYDHDDVRGMEMELVGNDVHDDDVHGGDHDELKMIKILL